MRFQIIHASAGRLRLRADVFRMTPDQADVLEQYLLRLPGVERVCVHERTRGVTVCYSGDRTALTDALAAFSWEKASAELGPVSHTGRLINREYKEKIVFHFIRHILKKLFLPAPLRRAIGIVRAIPYVWKGLRSLAGGRIRVELLDAAAIAASILTGDHETAGSVMFLLKLGDRLDEWTHKKSVDDLARSMALNIDRVWVRTPDGAEVTVPITDVAVGDPVVVRMGSIVPLDGTVTEGDVMVNQASMTGESVPVAKTPGSRVYAGTVVEEGSCVIRVEEAAGSGKYDRIVRMIEDSERLRSGVERRAAGLADRLVPWCLAGSALTYLLSRNVTRAVSVLMVDFSCALKLSMPLAVLSAMREASRSRVTVKGGKYMERLAEADTVIFDKTGTLTRACPTVMEVIPFAGCDETEMLRIAACMEEHFPHSMANAVVRAARERGIDHEELHSEVEYIVAHGIATRIGEQRAIIGSEHFVFQDEAAVIRPEDEERFRSLPPRYSYLYLAVGGVLSAAICIFDPLRPEARDAIRLLREEGVGKVVMLTGDSRRTAEAIAEELGVDEYMAEVLPEDKADFIRREREAGRTVVMVGDGINDAPALSLADVGVAIGDGAFIAREVADVTVGADDLRQLVVLKRLSSLLMERIRSNYRFVMLFNGALMALGALGILPPSASALMHNSSTLLLSLRSMTPLSPGSAV